VSRIGQEIRREKRRARRISSSYTGRSAPYRGRDPAPLLGLAALLARLDDYYLDGVDALTGGGSYGYGATTLTAQAAYLLFLSRYHPPEGFRPEWDEYPQVALRMVDAAGRVAWDEAGGYYYKSPSEPEIYLLADGHMVYALVEAYRFTGDAKYLDQAKRVVAALDRLLGDPDGKGYYALPPAVPSLGYKSLSSSCYAFKACALIYQETGEEAYLDKARDVMEFMMGELYGGDGIVYHHEYKGAVCSGDIWCPGCNFRVLQYLDYLNDLEKNGQAATKDHPYGRSRASARVGRRRRSGDVLRRLFPGRGAGFNPAPAGVIPAHTRSAGATG